VEQLLLDRPEEEKHGEDEEGGEDRGNVEAEADSHSDRRHHPDRGRGGQAVDLAALAEDGAGAKKPDPCHDLGRDTGRVSGRAEGLETQPREQARADSDEAQGLDSCRVAVELTLEADGDREDRGDEEAKREIDVAFESQGLTLSRAATGLAGTFDLGLVGELGEVEAVDEVAEHRKALLVHRLTLFPVV
jgi:hypothetical protein